MTASAWISRVVIAAVQLLVVRILIQSLGVENYAIFALLYGLSGWYLLADFGLGFSIQNLISERRQREEDDSDLILSGALLALILLVIEALALLILRNVAGQAFLRQFSLPSSEKASLFFFAGILLAGIGSGTVSYRIWYGQQRGYLSNLIPAAGALVGLVFTFAISRMQLQQRLVWSLIGFIGPNCAVAVGGLIILLSRTCTRQVWQKAISQDFKLLLNRAWQFWLFALLAAGVLQVDYLVIAQRLASDQIIIYTIATRIFLFVGTIYQSALFSIWPVFTELTVAKNWQLVKRNLQMYMAGGTALVLLCTVALLTKMQLITRFLSPSHVIVIPPGLILLLGGYYLVRVWTDSFATILQSMSDLKPLWTVVPIQAGLSAFLEWHFTKSLGPYGVVLGLILSYVLTVTWWLPLVVARHMKKAAPSPGSHAALVVASR